MTDIVSPRKSCSWPLPCPATKSKESRDSSAPGCMHSVRASSCERACLSPAFMSLRCCQPCWPKDLSSPHIGLLQVPLCRNTHVLGRDLMMWGFGVCVCVCVCMISMRQRACTLLRINQRPDPDNHLYHQAVFILELDTWCMSGAPCPAALVSFKTWSYLHIVSLISQLLRHFRGGLRAERKPSQAAARLSKEDGLHAQKKVNRYVLRLTPKLCMICSRVCTTVVSNLQLPLKVCCGLSAVV